MAQIQWHRGMRGAPIPAEMRQALTHAEEFLRSHGHAGFEFFSGIRVEYSTERVAGDLERSGHEMLVGVADFLRGSQASPQRNRPWWQMTFQWPNPDRAGSVVTAVLLVYDDGQVNMLG